MALFCIWKSYIMTTPELKQHRNAIYKPHQWEWFCICDSPVLTFKPRNTSGSWLDINIGKRMPKVELEKAVIWNFHHECRDRSEFISAGGNTYRCPPCLVDLVPSRNLPRSISIPGDELRLVCRVRSALAERVMKHRHKMRVMRSEAVAVVLVRSLRGQR